MARPPKYKITDEDINFLREVYPTGDWGLIRTRFPDIPRHKIYHIASDNNITMDSYFWSDHDKKILSEFYYIVPTEEIQTMLESQYTIRQIQNQAEKMKLTKNKSWTDEEKDLMFDKYALIGATGMMKLLPNRSREAILCQARNMDLHSNCYWSEEEKQFVCDNWESMTDQELAQALGIGVKGVADQRRKLGLYYELGYNGYYTIVNYIRMNIADWKKQSMQSCNYKCILTGKDFDDIHHLYSFDLMLRETILQVGINDKESIDDYTDEELNAILAVFKDIQAQHPLGVCLSRDVHKLFHKIYGYGHNTEEQWYEFSKNINRGY